MISLKHLLSVAAATALLYASVSALSIHVDNKGGSVKGSEEIGPVDNFTCPDNGAFPDDNCEYFYTCWEDQAVFHRCTEVQLFDLVYNGCNWAQYVDCGDRHRDPTFPPGPTSTTPGTTTTVDPTAPTTTTTPAPNSTFDCPSDGTFAHEERCEYYWLCYAGTAELYHCQEDWLFDLVYMGCNFPELTDCGDRTRPPGGSTPGTTRTTPGATGTTSAATGTTEPGNTGGPGFECPSPNGKFPDPEDCGSFYSCVANTPIHESCPPGLHFNPVLEICDWPEAAGCEV